MGANSSSSRWDLLHLILWATVFVLAAFLRDVYMYHGMDMNAGLSAWRVEAPQQIRMMREDVLWLAEAVLIPWGRRTVARAVEEAPQAWRTIVAMSKLAASFGVAAWGLLQILFTDLKARLLTQ